MLGVKKIESQREILFWRDRLQYLAADAVDGRGKKKKAK
jgi:hypothetical protein